MEVPMSAVISLFLLASGVGCDKGSDSSGEGDADTDTDSDTDTDTDTDTDLPDTLTGSIELTVVDATGKDNLCDTSIDLTGEEGGGGCLGCDFTFDLQTDIASEKGTKCVYNNYPYASMLEEGIVTGSWLGFSEAYNYGSYVLPNALFWGWGTSTYPGPNWTLLTYDGAYGDVTYSAGTIGWSLQYSQYGFSVPQQYCDYYDYYGGIYNEYKNFGGNYTAAGSLDCGLRVPYQTWTFTGVDDTYAYVSLDTVSADTAFDPRFFIMDSDTCNLAIADENFECSFPPPSDYWCPAHKLATTTGEVYTVFVYPFTDCNLEPGTTGDYTLYIKANSDPSLTPANEGELTPVIANVSAQGTVTITKN
jgi:hypothetical protein